MPPGKQLAELEMQERLCERGGISEFQLRWFEVTYDYPRSLEVTIHLWKGHLFSQSQKGHQPNSQIGDFNH